MTDSIENITVQILGKNFTLKVPGNKAQDLEYTVKYLNDKILELRQHGGIVGYENLVTLAALTITDELLNTDNEDGKKALYKVTTKLDEINMKLKSKISQYGIEEL